MIYLAATGGGAGVQAMLTREPASDILIGCEFPYNKAALDDFLGEAPIKYCSEETAILMAKKCYQKALKLGFKDVLGVGITAVVATNRILKGDHRAYISTYDGKCITIIKLVFAKNSTGRSAIGRRLELEYIDSITASIINKEHHYYSLYMNGISGDFKIDDGYIIPTQRIIIEKQNALHLPDGQLGCLDKSYVLYPGSFNPLHDGHLKLANAMGKVVFMINDNHPDKGNLSEEEINKRVQQFAWKHPVMVTHNLPLFIDKARAFPGFSFLIGYDTYERILDQRYSPIPIKDMLDEFEKLGTWFFVADRNDKCIKDHGIFFRIPIQAEGSSTEIRNDKANSN